MGLEEGWRCSATPRVSFPRNGEAGDDPRCLQPPPSPPLPLIVSSLVVVSNCEVKESSRVRSRRRDLSSLFGCSWFCFCLFCLLHTRNIYQIYFLLFLH